MRDKEAEQMFERMKQLAEKGEYKLATETSFALSNLLQSDQVSLQTCKELSEKSMGLWSRR